MEPNKIRALLTERGVTITSIAEALGVKQPTVSQTIYGRTVSLRIRAAIAAAIGKPVEEIWPEQRPKKAA